MSDPLERLRMPIVPIEPHPEFAEALLRRLSRAAADAGAVAARDTASIRYFVDDLDAAVAFYRDLLGFDVELWPSPAFAMLYRGDLRLLLTVPGGHHVLPDGTLPAPGGHNRISLLVDDLAAAVAGLRREGATVRTSIAGGVAVDTALLQDPAGNPIELFSPRSGYHERRGPSSSTATEEEPK